MQMKMACDITGTEYRENDGAAYSGSLRCFNVLEWSGKQR